MKQITFFLVRHGEAENNVRHILNSAPVKQEYPLTEHGKEQATRTAKQLATAGADVLFSSPILRAKETAESIAAATGLPIQFDNRLWEVGMGRFNNHIQQELLDKYPDPEMRLSPDVADGMESFLEVRSRLDDFLGEVKEKYLGKKVIIVSHGDPLEQLHGILTQEGPGRAAAGWYPEKGSCTEVVWAIKGESV
ncbi:MAG: histidine phosphatase family protein [Candidatus Moranbacteria bacterium]|nr:histidine phosphatase family protein [Candidatus Moranbacteria bacterium]